MMSLVEVQNGLGDLINTRISMKAFAVCKEAPFVCYLVNSIDDLGYPVDESRNGFVRVELDNIAEFFYFNCDAGAGGYYGFAHSVQVEGILTRENDILILKDISKFQVDDTSEGVKVFAIPSRN